MYIGENTMIRKSILQICKDPTKIENFNEAFCDETQTWECHHRLETQFIDGTPRPIDAQITAKELKALDMYYNRPAEELIFLTKAEHRILHHKGKKLSDEHKAIAVKNLRKDLPRTKKWNEKISNTLKGHEVSEETRKKISKANKGKKAWNKGVNTGEHWYTNGVENVKASECPEGFWKGRVIDEKTRKHMGRKPKGLTN